MTELARQTNERPKAMNWDQLEGKWKEPKGRDGDKWGKLSDDDLATIAGKRDRSDQDT